MVKKTGKVVGLTFDLKTDYTDDASQPPDYKSEFDTEKTINTICAALTANGHTTVKLGNAEHLLRDTSQLKKVDIVFNIAEGRSGRNRESQVPTILEMCGVPFVGSDALTLGLTLDKVLTKKILEYESIPTPRFIEVNNPDDLNKNGLRYPLIVKPRHEGSSKGLSEKSVVADFSELKTQAAWLVETYKQPALVEEFIEGMEFTVALIGNASPDILPPVQVRIDRRLHLGRLFYTNAHIADDAIKYICPAKIAAAIDKKIKQTALRTYRAVECRDFGRVDIRVDSRGTPYVLEINPLPSLSLADVFNIIPQCLGTTYAGLINRVLDAALERYGMKN